MNRWIATALMVFGVMVWAYKKYGVVALMAKRKCRHAGIGRARRTWFWNRGTLNHRDLMYNASDLVDRLRAERAELAGC